jgi:hypothetical protein
VAPRTRLLIGDLILCEVLQGLRAEAQAARVGRALGRFEPVCLLDHALAARAAANHRFLRRRGITIGKTIDLVIGTFCIERRHALLHDDRDCEPMERLLGLKTA